MNKTLLTLISVIGCLIIPTITVGRNLYIFDSESNPVEEVTVVMYNAQMDSIGTAVSNTDGLVILPDSLVKCILVDHPSYSSLLSGVDTDTLRLTKSLSLKDVVVTKNLKTQYLTHESYTIPLEQMRSYNNFYQALNEIPNLVVLGNGALFFEGNSNVKLLLNGVATSHIELSSIAKDEISRVNVYKEPPAQYAMQGYTSVIDVLTKDRLYGGNMAVSVDQAFHPLKGDNSLAMFYNYRRSRFSFIYANSNAHYKKYVIDEELDYTHDGVHYNKKKEGHNSKKDYDDNSLSLSFQNNLAGSYLYNFNIGGALNRENQSVDQMVRSNLNSTPFDAINRLNTKFDKFWIANYFDKYLGESAEYGRIVANIRWQQFNTNYFSSYEEFDGDNVMDFRFVDSHSAYKTRVNGVFGELNYASPVKSWGQLFFILYDTYKHSEYLDSRLPFSQNSNVFGSAIQYNGHTGKLYYNARLGIEGYHTMSSNLSKSYNMWIPSPKVGLTYMPNRTVQLRLNYSYSGGIPSIAQLSETNQWLDTKLVYHGNNALKPYKDHNVSFVLGAYTKYLYSTLKLGYSYSPNMICSYFRDTEDYMLQTIVNLRHYSVLSSQLDLTFCPLGNNKWTIWTRVIGEKVHGKGDEYKWDGYRFQWMVNSRVNLEKWSIEAFYQYPGRIAEGQLIRPRAECWRLTAYYRPVDDLSIGVAWFMPFGKSFSDSEKTVKSAPVQTYFRTKIKDMANMVSLSLSWNFSFGRNKNRARPGSENSDNDSGILKK